MLNLFLDANVYFAGFTSREGASFFVLEVIKRKKITLSSSRLVLKEAERNLRAKSSSAALEAFHHYIQKIKMRIVPPPEEKTLTPFETLIHPKDLPVLGAAVRAKADYLLTLDKRHFLNPNLLLRVKKPPIMTPGNFLRDVYLKGRTS